MPSKSVSVPQTSALPVILVVDSNILFTRNDTELVNKQLLERLAEVRKYTPVQLCIPRVCLAEIIFQKCNFADTQLAQANKALRIIAKLTGRAAPPMPTSSVTSRALARQLLRWCKQNDVLIAETPIKHINWKRLIEKAIWHIPPFSPTSAGNEKGFKDTLVLETVVSVCQSNQKSNVVLVTADKLLHATAKKHFAANKSIIVFENLEDWLNHLRLAQEKRNKEWADKVLAAAPKIFYDPTDPNCLYFRETIPTKIRESNSLWLEDSEFFHPMEMLVPKSAFSFGTTSYPSASSPLPSRKWTALSEDKIWIMPPEYLSSDSQGFLHWKSTITFAKLYEESTQNLYLSPTQYVRRANFAVLWKAKVSGAGDFTQTQLEKIDYTGSTADLANTHLKLQYGLFPHWSSLGETLSSAPSASDLPSNGPVVS